jgi:hypothetical protein
MQVWLRSGLHSGHQHAQDDIPHDPGGADVQRFRVEQSLAADLVASPLPIGIIDINIALSYISSL